MLLAYYKGAPFIPMSWQQAKRMAELAQIKPGQRAVDLGSGDGRVMIALAKQGAIVEGCEIQPWLVLWATLRLRWAGVKGRVRRGDMRQADCSRADVVTLYTFPSIMKELEIKLGRELKPGARVVSLTFPFADWKPVYQEGHMWVYEK
jgi:hypothetical protein